MEGGGAQPATQSGGSDWPAVTEEERILYETLFYSQGPVDGYLLGEGVQDLFLKSGLSLRVLSQIWNLADVSNDNVLTVHEFVLAMHLIRGLLRGLKLPPTLPRKLAPPKTDPVGLQPATPQEREAYTKLFHALDVDHSGTLDGERASHVLLASGLSREVLGHVWNLADVNRDGRLDLDEFCLACHLLRYVKAGNSLSGPVDVFKLLPERIAAQSLQARKQRVQKYEQHKQKLMSLKEKRRQQVLQENKRLQLLQEKIDLLQKLYKLQKKVGRPQIPEETFKNNLAREKEEEEKLEEIVYRLKKEHEKVRQETVKIILAEQKLNNDIQTIKKDTDELNKRLSTSHTHATKDPDPFHQLYEQRKEKRQGSTIKDLDKIHVTYPFSFNPFDPGLTAESVTRGAKLFQESGGNNHPPREQQVEAVVQRLGDFGEEFLTNWGSPESNAACDMEEDTVFKEVPVSMENERWLGLQWEDLGTGVLGLDGHQTEELHEKLLALKEELQKLNEPGTRLLFKNPDDYLARKRAKEEEEKSDRARFHRRSATERRSAALPDRGDSPLLRTRSDNNSPRLRGERYSYTERSDDVSQAVREYRQKRQSAQSLESSISANSSLNNSPRASPKAPERPSRSKRPLSSGSGLDSPRSPRSPGQDEAASFPGSPGERSERSPGVKEETAGVPSSPGRASRPKDLTGITSRSSPPTSPKSVENTTTANTSTSSTAAATITTTTTTNTVAVTATSASPESTTPSAGSVSNSRDVTSEIVVKKDTSVEKKAETQRAKSPEGSSSVSPTRPSSKKTRAPPPPPAGSEVKASKSSTSPPPSTAASSAASPRAQQQPSGESAQSSKPAAQSSSSSSASAGESRVVNAGTAETKQDQVPAQSSQRTVDTTADRQPAVKSIGKDTAVPLLNLDQAEPESPRESKDKPLTPSPERPARPKRRKESGSTSNPASPNDAPSQPVFSAGNAAEQNARSSGGVATGGGSVNSTDGFGLVENLSLVEEEVPKPGGTVTVVSQTTTKTASPRSQAPASGSENPAPISRTASGDNLQQKRTSRKGKAPAPPAASPREVPQSSSSSPSPGNSPRDGPPSAANQNSVVQEAPVKKREEKVVETVVKSPKTKTPPPRPPTSPTKAATSEPFSKPVSQEQTVSVRLPARTEAPEAKPKLPDSAVKTETSHTVPESESPASAKETVKTTVPQEAVKPEPLRKERPEPPAAVKAPAANVALDRVPATVGDFEQVRLDLDKEVVVEKADSDRGRASETSSAYDSDADSIPPPLPSSAPPPLPSSPPPSSSPSLLSRSAEEVIVVQEVVQTRAPPPTSGSSSYNKHNNNNDDKGKMEEGVLIEFDSMLPDTLPDTTQDSQTKTMSDLRAEFFGLDSTGDEGNNSKVNGRNLDLLDMNFDTLQPHNNRLGGHHDDMSGDSDLSSDEKGFEGTFSPGDSGVLMSSIPTSPDESDGGKIQLVSYRTDQTQTHSQPRGDNSFTTVTTTKTQYSSNSSSTPRETSSSSSPSSRPKTLQMRDDPSSTSSSSQQPGSTQQSAASGSLSPEGMAALSPRSREIFEKARHFADMVQKPTFVAKRENVEDEEFSQETLQDFEMERRAVISQSMVRRKDVKDAKDVMSPTRDVGFSLTDTVEPAPIDVGVTSQELQAPSPERAPSPVPEAKWNDHSRNCLYSENVVQEPDSTDRVDRESIANLATTRRQWETIFTSSDAPAESPRKPKKSAPKWEVRLPYAEKKVADANTVTSSSKDSVEVEIPQPKTSSSTNMADTGENESAIEREIRLAMEREEMLKREQEERLQQQRGGLKPSSMQSSTESELQPSYHELTEADRGAEFLMQDRVAQREDAEQEESLQRGSLPLLHTHQKHSSGGNRDENPAESIIEREIRLQREREAELAKQRGGRTPAPPTAYSPPEPEVHTSGTQSPAEEEVADDGEVKEIEYEEAISQYHHEGESRIAQELRELREREEEMRRLREAMSKTQVSAGSQQQQKAAAPTQPPKQSTPPPKQQPPKTVTTTPRKEKPASAYTPPPPSTPRGNVHASPHLDTNATPKNEAPTPKQETPIEREIRLAQERENELRRAKGLPELKTEPAKQENVDLPEPDQEFSGTPRRYYASPQPDSSMRRFASNRLQQEIVDQRNREMTLRQEGKIITTSEEHIQPLKYNEVIGGDRVDGPVKRSFKVPARRGSSASQDNLPDSTTEQIPVSTPRGGAGAGSSSSGKKTQAAAASFSYREFKQTAESKIERELREMREREEELRKQRGGVSAENGVAAQ